MITFSLQVWINNTSNFSLTDIFFYASSLTFNQNLEIRMLKLNTLDYCRQKSLLNDNCFLSLLPMLVRRTGARLFPYLRFFYNLVCGNFYWLKFNTQSCRPYNLFIFYLFIYLFSHSQNLMQHEQKLLIKLIIKLLSNVTRKPNEAWSLY